jgi:hypothetical protein
MEKDAYQKKTSLAAAISQKEGTRPPVFDQSAADERKNRELWGDSGYQKKENKREFRPPQTGMDAVLDRNTKNKVANQLASNVLSNDDETRAQRSTWNKDADKLMATGGQGWAAQENNAKTQNKGGVDAYRQRQNQLGSNVMDMPDYSQYQPLNKKETKSNDNFGRTYEVKGAKPKSDINETAKRQPLGKNAK